MNLIDDAFAMGAPPGGAGGGGMGPLLGSLLPFLVMFLILYFLLIRPQQKKQREHKTMLDELKNGDRVITSGGMYGTVAGMKADVISLRVADNVKIDMQKSAIAHVVDKKNDAGASE